MPAKPQPTHKPHKKPLTSSQADLYNTELECLPGDDWILPFCNAYGLKEHCWHGEAGSVNIQPVEEEHKQLGMTLVIYPPKNRWNIDESSLFVL